MNPIQLGERIKTAMQAYAQANGPTSHAAFGEAVAKQEGRDQPYSPDEVFGWLSPLNMQAPSLGTLRAIAALVKFNAPNALAYMAYGDEQTIHALDEADYDRVHGRDKARRRNR